MQGKFQEKAYRALLRESINADRNDNMQSKTLFLTAFDPR